MQRCRAVAPIVDASNNKKDTAKLGSIELSRHYTIDFATSKFTLQRNIILQLLFIYVHINLHISIIYSRLIYDIYIL